LVAACLRLLTVVGRGVHADAVRPLLSDDRFFIRAAAIVALGKLGSKEDVDAIVAAVDDSSPWVPIRSAHALADLHAPDALARLTAMGGVPAAAAIETLYEGVT
jgi:HEAT repeat protein